MSRSNYSKPFYVDVGTSIVAIRCASNRDVIAEYDYEKCPQIIRFTKDTCDRMNKEAEIGRPLRNCDVGNPDEQYARFKKWCVDEFYKRPMDALPGEPCKSCPCYQILPNGVDGCNFLRWAQMPYTKGETK